MMEAGNSPANTSKPSSYHYHPIPPDLRELSEELETLGGGDTRLGRLEVICRVAPQRSKSNYSRGAGSRSKASAIVLVEGSSVVLRDPRTPSAEAIKFPVTAAYDAREEDTTVDAALSLGPLDWLWDGFNGTLMAMGAQSTGKTRTLIGGRVTPNSCGGVVGSLLTCLFQRTRAAADAQPRGQPAHAVALSVWEVRPCAAQPVVDLLQTESCAATTDVSKNTSSSPGAGSGGVERGQNRDRTEAQRGVFASIECSSASDAFAVLHAACRRSQNWVPAATEDGIEFGGGVGSVEDEEDGPSSQTGSAPVLVAQRNHTHFFVRITLVELTGRKSVAALHVVDLAGHPNSMEWVNDATAAASASSFSSSSRPPPPPPPSQGYAQAEATRREIAQGLSALERVLAELGQCEEAQERRSSRAASSNDASGGRTGSAATRAALTCARETSLTRMCGPLLCGNGKTWLLACVKEASDAVNGDPTGSATSTRQATQHTLSTCLKAASVCAACQRTKSVDLAALKFEPASKALARLQSSPQSVQRRSTSRKAFSRKAEVMQEEPSSAFDWTTGGASSSEKEEISAVAATSAAFSSSAAAERRPPSPPSSEEEEDSMESVSAFHGNNRDQVVHSHLVSEDDVRRSANDSLDGAVMPLQSPSEVMRAASSLLAEPQKPSSRSLLNTSVALGAPGVAPAALPASNKEESDDREAEATTHTSSGSGSGATKMAAIQTEIARVVQSLLPPHSRNSPTPPLSPNHQPWSNNSPRSNSSSTAEDEDAMRSRLNDSLSTHVPVGGIDQSTGAWERPSSPAPLPMSLLDLASEPLEEWNTTNAPGSSAPSTIEQVVKSCGSGTTSRSEVNDLNALFLSSFGTSGILGRSHDAEGGTGMAGEGNGRSAGVGVGGESANSRSAHLEASHTTRNESNDANRGKGLSGDDSNNEDDEDDDDSKNKENEKVEGSGLRVRLEGNDNDDEEYLWPTSPVAGGQEEEGAGAAMSATTPRAFHAINHRWGKEDAVVKSTVASGTRPAGAAATTASQRGSELLEETAAPSSREEALRLDNMSLLRKCRALEGALSQAQRNEAQRARAKEPLRRGTTPPLPTQPQPPPPPRQPTVNRDEHPDAPPAPPIQTAKASCNNRDVGEIAPPPRSVVHETITKETRARKAHASSLGGAEGANSAQLTKKKKPWGAAEPSRKVPPRNSGSTAAAATRGDVNEGSLREDLQRARRRADSEGARADKAQGRVAVLERELASLRQSAQKRSVDAAQQVCARLQARLNDALTQAETRSAALNARDVQVLRLEAELAEATSRAHKAEAQASRAGHEAKSLSILCQQLRQIAVQTHAQGVERPVLVEKFVGKHHGRPPPPPQAGAAAAPGTAAGAAGARIMPALPAATVRVDVSLARLASVMQQSSTNVTSLGGNSSSNGGFDHQWLDTVQRSVRQVQGGLRRHPDCTSLIEVAGRVEALAIGAAKQQATRDAALVDVLTALLDERGDDTAKAHLLNAFKGNRRAAGSSSDGGASNRKGSTGYTASSMMPFSKEPGLEEGGRERSEESAVEQQRQMGWRRDHHLHRSLDDAKALRREEGPRVHFQTTNGSHSNIPSGRGGAGGGGSDSSSKIKASNFLRRSADAAVPVHPLPDAFLEAAAMRARRNMP